MGVFRSGGVGELISHWSEYMLLSTTYIRTLGFNVLENSCHTNPGSQAISVCLFKSQDTYVAVALTVDARIVRCGEEISRKLEMTKKIAASPSLSTLRIEE
jgi:hypothetical protein